MGEECSLPEEQRGMDKLGHGKEANKRSMLTSWSTDRETSQGKCRQQRNKALTIWRCK
jgi:hypothetical protein